MKTITYTLTTNIVADSEPPEVIDKTLITTVDVLEVDIDATLGADNTLLSKWDATAYADMLAKMKGIKTNKAYKAYQDASRVDITYMGTTFQADDFSQMMIARVLSAGAVPLDFYWLDVTNTKTIMTFADLQGLSLDILTRGQLEFDVFQTLKSDIDACTTINKLEAVIV